MPSTFFGLSIGTSGLYAYQAALDTTAHNASNAERDGYTRQVVTQSAAQALRVNSKYGMAGTGVEVTGVTQIRNEYYDIKFRNNNSMYGAYSTKEHYMVQIENYFNEITNEGFTTSYNKMNNSLDELAKDPSNLTVRTQVTNFAKSVTEYFNSLSNSLESIQEEANFEVKNKADQINSLAQQIAGITKQINTLEVNGGIANDLRDSRAILVDELSEIANISVTEQVVGSGVGVTSYTVRLDRRVLVDTTDSNQLVVVPREEKLNQNDIDGLYDIIWSNGQTFDMSSPTLGGTLSSLFEVRDGNNSENLRGTVSGETGDLTVTMTSCSINDINKLNIPETGVITIGNRNYKYVGFEVAIDEDTGDYTYEFELEEGLVTSVEEGTASIGRSIDYKGIPYYMGQMNQFVRTYSAAFNNTHKQGQDLKGQAGIDFFNAIDKITGENYKFDDVNDENYIPNYFNSSMGSYYKMTAENFTITEEVYTSPSKFAAALSIADGVEDHVILDKLIALKTDKSMFKQGQPAAFLQTMIAEIGIDTEKATNFSTNQQNILHSVSNQRLSVSGVDADEEAMNLVRFKNAYDLSAKVISVMDEIYDKLINYMGV